MPRPMVYLAGPEVFFPNAREVGEAKKAICAKHGLEGLFPLDWAAPADLAGQELAMWIYRSNRKLMDRAHAIIANLTPFRGVSADPGTVYELGYMTGRRRRAAAYTADPRPFLDRHLARFDLRCGEDGRYVDCQGRAIEDFGLRDNLMLDCGLIQAGMPVVSGAAPVADGMPALEVFEACVEALRPLLR